ncbi:MULTISPECIES: reprolysin-like metallopeptidase [unclassified Flavobacterium]|uniref:reprolysin-like metallopeptidase n=1 Tax=unclassified Flavobacterium TaxID=196869 RepID=UPI00129144D7|nr:MULTISPECIES: GEVED domain-containing protein [unclassified Flavobacterium]MQP53258.1 T9SS type A sorting domain-containing protein [Flavobacterium sp. LMO9]MQP63269.1 T9SS type A sorting domain-containing protein [Flavobacterium sp. LMO6]
MKQKFLLLALLATSSFLQAQDKGTFWKTAQSKNKVALERKLDLPENQLLDLDVSAATSFLRNAPERFSNQKSSLILSLPNADGAMDQFRIYENSNMEPELAARYPEIKSYIGIGIENPTASAYISISPLGFKSMVLNPGKPAVFVEPFSQDLQTYTVYTKSDKKTAFTKFECSVLDRVTPSLNGANLRPNADDGSLRTFRLAMSVTGEYTAYFGGTKALALAAINNTMTRVNGVFEKDFNARMVLISNTDLVIYTSASSDPYSASSSMSNWNQQLQTTLTNTIGNANYDVGHLFGATGGGGNAGCIGCVCVNPTSTVPLGKGSGYTSPANGVPSGDAFDIDYVAHELGHQFGANHTFSMSNEGTGANMEPGSGSTIMGYAGITSQDIQMNSDPYFHSISIQQVTNNIKTKTCPTLTATGNSIPTANAGLDYTIPKSTPFMLTGSGTDANGDALTYIWEQFDNASSAQTGASSAASATKTSGPTFRSYSPTTSPIRYFPNMSRVLAGATTTSGSEIVVEALPSVARTLNFRFTVRDNRAGGSSNNSDDMKITVNATAGPFVVTAPNTAVSYVGGSTQTITWNVAGTTANGVNCANVDILISTNGGSTWSTLLAATPNDGTQSVTIPNTAGTQNRIMIKGTNHIFFDVSNTNFTITAGSTADTTAPSTPTLSASGTTQTSTNLAWTAATDNVGVTGYDVYRGTTLLTTVTGTTYTASGLTASTAYTFTVRAKDAAGNVSASSNTVNVTTLAATTTDTTAPSASTLSASGTTQTSTNLSWTAATDNVGVTGYNVYQGTTLVTTVTGTTYTVTGLTAATTYSFSVKAKDAAGNLSTTSNTVNVTTLAATSVTYCTSQGNNTADERIGRVQFGTINNASTGTAGYEDFTNLSTNLSKGTSYTITITPTWTGTVYSEGYGVWIDYNGDKDFDDAGELVWSNAASTTTPVSGSFNIPTSAITGATRLRVVMRYNTIPSSCGAFDYGQVEDYTVNLITATADTTAPSASTLSASGTTQTSTNLSWTAATDNVGVTGYNVYQGTTLVTTVTGTTYTVTGLTAATTYSFSVKAKDAAGNLSATSNTVNVTTLAATSVTYCTSQGNNTADERIGRVQFGTINNASTGTAGYENFSSISTNVVRGTSNTITITPTWTGTIYNEGYAVFIDYNNDGDFLDAGETVFTKTASKTTPVSGSFTIPATTSLGAKRMRVSMKYNGVPTSCESFSYGQVEDYTINVTSSAKESELNPFTISLYPNPVKGDVLNISGFEGEGSYRIFSAMGQDLGNGKVENNTINVGNLAAGTYMIEVTSANGTNMKRFIKQ